MDSTHSTHSTHMAHVADVITKVTGNTDYDDVADQAAQLLGKSMALRMTAKKYADDEATDDDLQGAVRHAIRL